MPGGMSISRKSKGSQIVMASSSSMASVLSLPRKGTGCSPLKAVKLMKSTVFLTRNGLIPESSSGKRGSTPRRR